MQKRNQPIAPKPPKLSQKKLKELSESFRINRKSQDWVQGDLAVYLGLGMVAISNFENRGKLPKDYYHVMALLHYAEKGERIV